MVGIAILQKVLPIFIGFLVWRNKMEKDLWREACYVPFILLLLLLDYVDSAIPGKDIS